MALPDSFWSKTKRTDCIIWTGAVNNRGYGCFAVDGVSQLAHRLAYADANGPIPDGLVIDHLCRVHNCVNPDHLEAVTPRVNAIRGVRLQLGGSCINGHRIKSQADIYEKSNGARECMECRRSNRRRLRHDVREVNADAAAVRDWAFLNGYSVSPKGRISREVRDAYIEATMRGVA